MKVKKVLKDRVLFVGYNLAVVIVFLLISEGILSFWLKNPAKIPSSLLPAFRAYYTEHLRSTIQMEPDCAVYDSGLFYTLRPGRSNFENLEFRTQMVVNRVGVRDDEISLEGPEIIFLGDSYTMGWGVHQDSTFVSTLERRLQSSVLNAGISSYGTVREMKMLDRLDHRNLETLVIQYHTSDLVENKAFDDAGDSLIVSSKQKFRKTSEMVRERAQYFFGKHTALVSKYVMKDFLDRLEVSRPTGREDVRYFLNALDAMPLPDGINVVVFELSNYGEGDNMFITELTKVLENSDFPKRVKSLTILDVQKELGKDDYFVLDNHINQSGHKKLAAVLETTLRGL